MVLFSRAANASAAMQRPITCNGGYSMNGWYDIQDISGINRTEDDAGVKDSAK